MNNQKKVNTKYAKIIGNILVIIALLFLIKRFYALNIDVSSYYSKKHVIIVIILLVIFSLLLSVQSLPWIKIICRICNIKFPFHEGNKVFCKSSLYKYIPGNIFQYIGRSSIVYKVEGINYSNVLTSIIIEAFCVIIASSIISIVFCWNTLNNYLFNHVKLLVIVTIILIAILIMTILFRNRLKLILIENNIFANRGLIYDIIFSIIYFLVSIFIQGGILAVIVNQLNGSTLLHNILLVIGAYSFSWVIGYITPGASGGIGVRETILCLVLGHFYPESIILVSVIIYRILNIISDVGAYLLSYLWGVFIESTIKR